MVTGIEWGILSGITLLTGLLSAWIVYRVIRKGLKATINGYIPVVGKTIRSEMRTFMDEALEGVDMGAVAGSLGGSSGGLGDIAGMLGGGDGGLGQLLQLFTQFSGGGKQTTKGKGKMGL